MTCAQNAKAPMTITHRSLHHKEYGYKNMSIHVCYATGNIPIASGNSLLQITIPHIDWCLENIFFTTMIDNQGRKFGKLLKNTCTVKPV